MKTAFLTRKFHKTRPGDPVVPARLWREPSVFFSSGLALFSTAVSSASKGRHWIPAEGTRE